MVSLLFPLNIRCLPVVQRVVPASFCSSYYVQCWRRYTRRMQTRDIRHYAYASRTIICHNRKSSVLNRTQPDPIMIIIDLRVRLPSGYVFPLGVHNYVSVLSASSLVASWPTAVPKPVPNTHRLGLAPDCSEGRHRLANILRSFVLTALDPVGNHMLALSSNPKFCTSP
jgi:hypothetical protein